jgi:adenosylcobinamide-GDP ribazoletransferase
MESNGHMEARAWLKDIANATMFLTRLPLPPGAVDPSRSIAQASRAFPLIGLAVGAVTAAVAGVLNFLGLSTYIAAAIAVGVACLMTGALHEDGLADTADGFGGGKTRERKLEIMRDSRIGSYGVIALVLVLVVKVAAIAELRAAAPLILAAVVSRASVAMLLAATPNARMDGLSALAGRPSRAAAVAALALTAAIAVLVLFLSFAWQGIAVSLLAAAAVFFAVRSLALRQIGGQTGDVCGALQVLAETAMLAAWTATLP